MLIFLHRMTSLKPSTLELNSHSEAIKFKLTFLKFFDPRGYKYSTSSSLND